MLSGDEFGEFERERTVALATCHVKPTLTLAARIRGEARVAPQKILNAPLSPHLEPIRWRSTRGIKTNRNQ